MGSGSPISERLTFRVRGGRITTARLDLKPVVDRCSVPLSVRIGRGLLHVKTIEESLLRVVVSPERRYVELDMDNNDGYVRTEVR